MAVREERVWFNINITHFTISRGEACSFDINLNCPYETKFTVDFRNNADMVVKMRINRLKPTGLWRRKMLWLNIIPIEGFNWLEYVTDKLWPEEYDGLILSSSGNAAATVGDIMTTIYYPVNIKITGLGMDGGAFQCGGGNSLKVRGRKALTAPRKARFTVRGI